MERVGQARELEQEGNWERLSFGGDEANSPSWRALIDDTVFRLFVIVRVGALNGSDPSTVSL